MPTERTEGARRRGPGALPRSPDSNPDPLDFGNRAEDRQMLCVNPFAQGVDPIRRSRRHWFHPNRNMS